MALPDHVKGLLVTGVGVLALSPDSLLVRLTQADHWTILFWRGVLTSILILGALALFHRGRFISHVRAVGSPGLVFALVFGVSNVLYVISVLMTSVANALFIYATAPLFSALFSLIYLKEHVSKPTWVAIFCALIGVGIIVSGSFEKGAQSVQGDLLALGAAIAVAISFGIARKCRDRSMVPAMGLASVVTAAIALPFVTSFDVGGDTEVYVLLNAAFVAVATGLLTIGPRYLPAPEVGLLLLLEAVIGPYWVWLVLGEDPGSRALMGGLIVIMTLVLLNGFLLWRNRVTAA